MSSVDKVSIFTNIGLSEQKAIETAKNDVVSANLMKVIDQAEKNGPIDKEMGKLLYHISTKMKQQIRVHQDFLVTYVASGQIKSDLQLNAALDYLLHNPIEPVDVNEFEAASGVGIIVTPEEVESRVESCIRKNVEEIKKLRYRFNTGQIMEEVRKSLKWADGKSIKCEIDMQILDILGPKTEEDMAPKKTKNKKPVKEVTNNNSKDSVISENILDETGHVKGFMDAVGDMVKFHKPGENYKTDGYVITPKTMTLLKKHLCETGGKVITRFPPEPNGILHIGHAKAINFNFGYAKINNGHCYLRYDDTNPEKEEEKFFRGIQEMVEWLGYTPWKITHASDNFGKLYEYAVELIKRGQAYVCHMTQDEVKGHDIPDSPWRDRPTEENLRLFEDMKNGKFNEGDVTLRMKTTLEEGKKDPVAYRIKYTPHHRSGSTWCVYPTYDFTHCLCDSIENISHSLCTKEFQSRRSSYYWLCNAIDVYCPVQWEYSRLNLNYTVVSKRKIGKLITSGLVRDWDDPRLFTLTALRRRGVPPEAVNLLCAKVGVTMAQTIIDPSMLDACIRDVLNVNAPRAMAVLEPLKVTIENFSNEHPSCIKVPNFPGDESKGFHDISISNVIYIDRDDFRKEAGNNYKRLSSDQPVGLRHAGLMLKVIKVIEDSNGYVTELRANCEVTSSNNKPKGFIHWVSAGLRCEIRLYDSLFFHKNPEDSESVPGGFLSDVNTNSLVVIKDALVDESVQGAPAFHQYQFERLGYFSIDPDSTADQLVFNRTVSLREDPGKN